MRPAASRDSQPTNRSHPALWADSRLWVFNQPLVAEQDGIGPPIIITSMVWCSTQEYQGLRGTATTYANMGSLTHTTRFSIAVWWVPNGIQNAFGRLWESFFNADFYLGMDAAGTGYKFIVNNGSSPYGTANGGTITDQRMQLVAGTYDGTTGYLYVDGRFIASSTFTSPSSPQTRTHYLNTYPGAPGATNGAIGTYLMALLVPHAALTPGDIAALWDDPWGLLQAPMPFVHGKAGAAPPATGTPYYSQWRRRAA